MRYYRGRPVGIPGEGSGDVRAARRDASWFRKPGVSMRMHVMAEDGGSACRGSPLILESVSLPPVDMTVRAVNVPEWSRCQGHGCKERWP